MERKRKRQWILKKARHRRLLTGRASLVCADVLLCMLEDLAVLALVAVSSRPDVFPPYSEIGPR